MKSMLMPSGRSSRASSAGILRQCGAVRKQPAGEGPAGVHISVEWLSHPAERQPAGKLPDRPSHDRYGQLGAVKVNGQLCPWHRMQGKLLVT